MMPCLVPVLLSLAASAQDAQAPADLVPADSIAVVRVQSIERAESAFARIVGAFGEESAESELFSDLPGNADLLDRTAPLLVAFSMPAGSPEPEVTLIARASDPAAFVQSLGGDWQAKSSGAWVALREGTEAPAAGPCALAKDLPEGLLGVRIDFGTLFQTLGPMLKAQLSMVQGMLEQETSAAAPASGVDAGKVVGVYFDFVRDFLDSAKLLELTVASDDRMTLDGRLELTAGSPLAALAREGDANIASMLPLLGADSAVSFAGAIDQKRYMDWVEKIYQPLIDSNSAAGPELQALLAKAEQLSSTLDGRMAGTFDLGSGGMRVVAAYGAKDPAAFVQQALAVAQDPALATLGVGVETVESMQVGEGSATQLRLRVDWKKLLAFYSAGGTTPQMELGPMLEKMFGADLTYALLPLADRVIVACGGDDAWRKEQLAARVQGGGGPAPAFAGALAAVAGANPLVVVRYDLGKLGNWVLSMARAFGGEEAADVPDLPTDLSFPLLVWWGAKGPTWKFGTTFSIDSLAKFAGTIRSLDGDHGSAGGAAGGDDDDDH